MATRVDSVTICSAVEVGVVPVMGAGVGSESTAGEVWKWGLELAQQQAVGRRLARWSIEVSVLLTGCR